MCRLNNCKPCLSYLFHQVEEVQWCKWMDLDEVEELIQTARFTPVGLSVLRRFLRERQLALS